MDSCDMDFLREAITVARSSREHGNHPFGAILVDDSRHEVLRAENTVTTGRDVTAHAEANLVRLAWRTFTPEQLAGFTLYASTEPCAMCAGTIHWSRIGRVVYALSEEDLYAIVGSSPENLHLPCREVFARSVPSVQVEGPCPELDREARAVHAGFWR